MRFLYFLSFDSLALALLIRLHPCARGLLRGYVEWNPRWPRCGLLEDIRFSVLAHLLILLSLPRSVLRVQAGYTGEKIPMDCPVFTIFSTAQSTLVLLVAHVIFVSIFESCYCGRISHILWNLIPLIYHSLGEKNSALSPVAGPLA